MQLNQLYRSQNRPAGYPCGPSGHRTGDHPDLDQPARPLEVAIKTTPGDVTLVDELVEGMLPIGAGLAPHDWSGVVVDAGSILGDVLPVGLHVPLTAEKKDTMRPRLI